MKFNATYNFLILLFLYAFCCTCVRGIEALYDTNLNMAVIYSDVWTASVITCFFAPLVIFLTYKGDINKDNLSSATGILVWSTIFNMLWLISLILVVMANLTPSVKDFLIGNLSLKPGLLGLLVNVFAIFAYCSSYYLSNKYIHLRSYKIITTSIIALLSSVSIVIAQSCLPVQYLKPIHKDGVRHDMLCDIESEIKRNPDWTPDKQTWLSSGSWYDKIDKTIKNGDISLSFVDDTHVKMSWKRNIEPEVLDKTGAKRQLLNSYKYTGYSWGCYYNQTEKVVEMKEKIEKNRKESNGKNISTNAQSDDQVQLQNDYKLVVTK